MPPQLFFKSDDEVHFQASENHLRSQVSQFLRKCIKVKKKQDALCLSAALTPRRVPHKKARGGLIRLSRQIDSGKPRAYVGPPNRPSPFPVCVDITEIVGES